MAKKTSKDKDIQSDAFRKKDKDGTSDAFRKKEEAFKKKNNLSSEAEAKGYVPQKTNREKALELLEKKGFKVSIKDNLLYCNCKDEDEYDKYVSVLLENFGRDGKVPFSFGASIANGKREPMQED